MFYVFPFCFFANNEQNVIRKSGLDLRFWIRDGFIEQCKTPTIDYELIFSRLSEISRKFVIEKLVFDKFNSALIIPKLQEAGIYCEVFEQNAMKFNFPIKYMEKLVYDKEITFQKNPVLLWNFRNIVLYQDGNNNVKFMKNKSLDSIDLAVASAMGIGAYLSSGQYNFDMAGYFK
jgi:phage terminase large subunit-like protein